MANPSSTSQSAQKTSLYVGDLKQDVTEALLFKIFNAVGPVASIRVCRDAVTRESLGYAYVNFHNVADAERALDTMNFTAIKGHPCRIMWSQRNPSVRKSGVGNIFVKNLSHTIDNKTLFDTFSMFGDILSCKVAIDVHGKSRGYGFVHYQQQDSADKAVEKVNGMEIDGKKVYVAPFKTTKDRGPVQRAFTNVFIKNMPVDWTEEKMLEVAQEYGEITSSYIRKTDPSERNPVPKCFGAVNYAEPESAAKACEGLSALKTETGENLFASRAQSRKEREKVLQGRREVVKREVQKKFMGVNLYVKNLSDKIDDEALQNLFGQFGAITSAKVMKDQATGKSRGFGFVCFAAKDMATVAMSELNSKLIDGKPLYVGLAQRKEERRAVLGDMARRRAAAAQNKMGIGRGSMGGGRGMGGQRGGMGGPQGGYYGGRPDMQRMPSGGPPTPHYMGGAPAQPQWGHQPQNMMVQRSFSGGVMPGQMQMMPGQAQSHYPPMMQRDTSGYGPPGGPHPGMGGHNPQSANHAAREVFAPQGQQPKIFVAQSADQGFPRVLNPTELATADPEAQKQMIGEKIFPLIQPIEPRLAGKITGMLLEMEITELLHLIDDNDALKRKINDALAVLKQYRTPGGPPGVGGGVE